jgi:galactose mutarotase-like enzyme
MVVGAHIHDANDQLEIGEGDDGNWVLQDEHGKLRPAARVTDLEGGRTLTVIATEPGIEFDTGSVLDGIIIGGVACRIQGTKRSACKLSTTRIRQITLTIQAPS